MVQKIQITVCYHSEKLQLCRIQTPNVGSFSPQLEQTHTWGTPLVSHAMYKKTQ